MYKALITDLDGSAVLLSSDGAEVTDETRAVIREARDAGYIIAAATGRAYSLAEPVLQSLGIDSYCVFDGGSSIIHSKSQDLLWEMPMDRDAANATLDVFTRECEGSELLYMHQIERPIQTVEKSETSQRFIYLINTKREVAVRIANIINAQGFAIAHVTPSWKSPDHLDIHVTSRDATKEKAINRLLEEFNLSKEEVIGLGDSGNDIPLFDAVGLRVASGSATPEIMNIADYTAPAPDEGGLAHTIQTFLLNQKEA